MDTFSNTGFNLFNADKKRCEKYTDFTKINSNLNKSGFSIPYNANLKNIGCYFRPYTARNVREFMNLRAIEFEYFKNFINLSTIATDWFGETLFTLLDCQNGEEIHQQTKIVKHIADMLEDEEFEDDD